VAERGEADGDVRFRTADMDVEMRPLQQQLASWRGEAQEQLAEAQSGHAPLPVRPELVEGRPFF
jgi:hypothetical protein